MLKVCQRPELIQQLQHGLSFADDATVNNALLVKYSLWDYLTPCDADNINILNACIQRWREEANKLYETTLFQYNPIENYDMEEKGKDKRTPDLTDETTYGGTNTYSETGYDVPRTLYDKGKNTAGGKDTTTKKGTETNDHELRRHGNIGTMTTQQMIEMERKIILDTLSWYVNKFRECFNVSMSISDYECCEIDLPPCDGMPPAPSAVSKLDMIDNELGALAQSLEDCCTHMSEELDALKKSSRDSKDLLAAAITDKGVPTAGTDTFQTMADNIAAIPTGGEYRLVAHWDFTQRVTDLINGLGIYKNNSVTQDSTGIYGGAYAQSGFGLSSLYNQTCMRYELLFSALSNIYSGGNPEPAAQSVRIITFYRSQLETGYIYLPSVNSGDPRKIFLHVNSADYLICDWFDDIVNHVLTIDLIPSPSYQNGPTVIVYIDGVEKARSVGDAVNYGPTNLDYLVVARVQNTSPFLSCYGVNYVCKDIKAYKMEV